MKVDKQHLQLLEILAQNCRISHAALGRALRISKDTVRYRISQLEESKLLTNYVLFVDARKLGFTRYHILIRFEADGISNELIAKLAAHEFVMWINTFIGHFDLQIIVDALDGFHLHKIIEELFILCNHAIKDYTVLTHLSDLEFTQLNPILDFNTEFEKLSDQSFSAELTTRHFPVAADFKRVYVNKLDVEILRALSDQPTQSLVDIATKVNCERQTVKRRILRLIEKEVILNFGGIPNLAELGFVTYYMLVRLEQGASYDEMKHPFSQLNNIFYAGKMTGDYDMIVYLNARNPAELNSSIQLFRKDLSNRVLNYDLLVQDRVHHWRQFTPGIFRELCQD